MQIIKTYVKMTKSHFHVSFFNPITTSIISEMGGRMDALQISPGQAKLPVLVHVNGISPEVDESGFFSRIINFGELLTSADS